MEISITSIKEEEMVLSIKEEDISILYILQHELLKDERVEFAGFALKHQLTQEYSFRIRAKDPIEAFSSAINNAINNTEVLEKRVSV